MTPIKNNPEEFSRFVQNPNPGPVVMLNLLKFKPDGSADYNRYLSEARSVFQSGGGKIVYQGTCKELLNGEETWDYLLLLEQPSRRAFLNMINNPKFRIAQEYRQKACERAILYATDPVTSIDPKEFKSN
jgi:uncharacterized protein (DUF1330 family)